MISFDTLPLTLRLPGTAIEFDPSLALRGWQDIYQNLLVVGQKLASGGQAAEQVCLVASPDDAEAKFGRGSMLAEMCKAIKSVNDYTELYAVALEDLGAGAAATGTVTFTGAPTAAGTLSLYVGGQRVRVGVAAGDTLAAIATACAAAVTAQTDLPVSATALAGVVTLTARHKGEVGNHIDLRVNYYYDDDLPKGLTATVAAMGGGSGNPDITDALSALGDKDYWYLVTPYTDAANLAATVSAAEDRWAWDQAHYMLVFAAVTGTQGTMAALGNTLNSQFISVLGAGQSPTRPEIVASLYGGLAAYFLNQDPARPLQYLKLKGMLAPALHERLPAANRDQLLHDGISPFLVQDDGFCYLESCITTHQVDAQGVEDAAWLWLNIPAQLAAFAYQVRAKIFQTYPRHKLADDNAQVSAGQAIVRPKDIAALLVGLYKSMERDKGIVEDTERFKKELLVERDVSDRNRVNAQIPPYLVGQFQRFFGRVQYRLNKGE